MDPNPSYNHEYLSNLACIGEILNELGMTEELKIIIERYKKIDDEETSKKLPWKQ